MPIFKVGTDDFKLLRDAGGYFVDKSLLIKEVIEGSQALLLPRPRRFGKTLNLSMLRYFFEKTPEDHTYLFHDLTIASMPEVMHHQGKYPEAVFHAFILGLLVNLRGIYEIHSNLETGYGRADILMRPRTDRFPLAFVIELKSIPPGDDLTHASNNALLQIEEKQYTGRLLEAGVPQENIRKLAVVLSGRQVKVQTARTA
jgi:hypothetical protein